VRGVVAPQNAGQKSRFAQNLKAVANAQNRFAIRRELGDRIHHRRKARDRAGAQIVAVRETAGNDDAIKRRQIVGVVPHELAAVTQNIGHDVKRVALAVGAGEDDDSEVHCCLKSGRVARVGDSWSSRSSSSLWKLKRDA